MPGSTCAAGHPADLAAAVTAAARSRPTAPAVSTEDGTLTYGQLLDDAGRAAWELRRRGAGPGDRIAVLQPPGAGAVVGMLAVLALGAAYVPVDPAQPEERLRHLLADCRPAAVLVDSPHRTDVVDPALAVPVLPAFSPRVEPAAAGWPEPPAGPADLAYVVYTSGSTGRPKGVQVEHRGVLNLIGAVDGLVPGAGRASWWTSPGFDVAVWEVWSPLTTGGELVVVPPRIRFDGPAVIDFLTDWQVTSGYLPPAFLPDLLDRARSRPGALALRRLLVGVEPIPLGLLQDLRAAVPGLRVLNGYGPAETTVCCTLYEVPEAGGDRLARTPIGTAVRGHRLHVLDPTSGRPAVEGELHVAGPGVSRGYLGRPDLTAERFGPEPGGPPASVAYRTGDLVRRAPDGTLSFLGRVDRQLKVRGHRVEPAEVEQVLRADPAVRDVVVGGTTVRGAGTLFAAVVGGPGATLDPVAVRRRVRRELPPYAVPAVVLVLDRLPQDPHGKIDHRALGVLVAATHPTDAAADGPPAAAPPAPTDISAAVAAELGLPSVEPEDNFLDLGGDSLAAARTATRLLAAGLAVSAADLLAADTLSRVTVRAPPAARPSAPPSTGPPATRLPVTGTARSCPLSSGQVGMVLHEQLSGDPLLYLEPLCFRVEGSLDTGRLAAAVSTAAAAHPVVGADLDRAAEEPTLRLGAWRTPLHLRVVEDTDRLAGELAALAGRPLDREEGLLRATLVRSGPQLHHLLLLWHHVAVDGWSARLFLRDLATGYAGGPPATPTRAIADIGPAAFDRPASRQYVAAAADQVAGLPPIRWPSGPAGPHPAAAELTVPVPPTLAARLAGVARAAGTTRTGLLLAAFQHAVGGVVDQQFAVGVAASTRPLPAAAEVVGCFVNTVLVPVRRPRATRYEQLANAGSTLRQVELSRQVPLADVVRELSRGLDRPVSAPQVYFTADELPTWQLADPRLRVRQRPLPAVRAKFDLTCAVSQLGRQIRVRLEFRPAVVPVSTAREVRDTMTDLLASYPDGVP